MAKQATALKDVEQVSMPNKRSDVISAENVHEISIGKRLALSFQHVFAMFGATVLVPKVTGLNPAVTLFAAGAGTLLFHQITKRKVPVFLGSSFAFMGAIQIIGKQYGLPYATGGIAVAGAFLALMSLVVALLGVERVKSLFPPIVTGPMIMVIGLTLSPTAISMASDNWLVASIVLLTMILVSTFAKGFFKLVPIVISIAVGYIVSVALGLVDFKAIADASWFALPPFVAPKFNMAAIATIVPVALVTMMEHIGDITTNGSVVGKDFIKDPGLTRTLLGDGLASCLSGLLGGPDTTTYAENTGVLAVTKVYDPSIIRGAAVITILLSLLGKFGAVLQTIPTAVMGGICVVLFGMIATIGMRTVIEANLDFSHSRNLIVASLILVMGLGGATINITPTISLHGMSLAAIVGIIVNKLLPENI